MNYGIEDGCKESPKLALKMAATFEYGIFTKPQPTLDLPIIRFDLSALGKVPGLGAIATEAIIKQLGVAMAQSARSLAIARSAAPKAIASTSH